MKNNYTKIVIVQKNSKQYQFEVNSFEQEIRFELPQINISHYISDQNRIPQTLMPDMLIARKSDTNKIIVDDKSKTITCEYTCV